MPPPGSDLPMTYVFEPGRRPSVAVAGTDARFPVRRIFCVGRNYAAHAREMGSDPEREPPFFFAKPGDAVLDAGAGAGAKVPYPPETSDFHHEVELAVAVGTGGASIDPASALEHVFGYAVALDLTRRDMQREAKSAGRPWALSKGFDHSAPVAPIHPASEVGHLARGRIRLAVDGEVRQDADLAELIWPVADVIAILSRSVALAPGDLILTGTPAGVGPLAIGERVTGDVEGLGGLEVEIVGR